MSPLNLLLKWLLDALIRLACFIVPLVFKSFLLDYGTLQRLSFLQWALHSSSVHYMLWATMMLVRTAALLVCLFPRELPFQMLAPGLG